MYTYTATIGRGTTEDTTLGDAQWAAFEAEVQTLFAAYTLTSDNDQVETHRGQGSWGGLTEESTMVTLLTVEGLSQHYITTLQVSLARIARRYEQDAIAFTVGQSFLIESGVTAH